MKVAVIGSRNLHITDLGEYLPENTTEIVSGGEKGIDSDAKRYAQENNVPMKEFLSDYKRFSRAVPLKRNLEIRIGKISDGRSPLLTQAKVLKLHMRMWLLLFGTDSLTALSL